MKIIYIQKEVIIWPRGLESKVMRDLCILCGRKSFLKPTLRVRGSNSKDLKKKNKDLEIHLKNLEKYLNKKRKR